MQTYRISAAPDRPVPLEAFHVFPSVLQREQLLRKAHKHIDINYYEGWRRHYRQSTFSFTAVSQVFLNFQQKWLPVSFHFLPNSLGLLNSTTVSIHKLFSLGCNSVVSKAQIHEDVQKCISYYIFPIQFFFGGWRGGRGRKAFKQDLDSYMHS